MFNAKKSENTISNSSYPWFSHVTELNKFSRELCLDYKISWCQLYSIPPYLIVDHPLLWEWQIEVISRIYLQKSYSETSGIFVKATIDLFLSFSLQIEGGLIKNGSGILIFHSTEIAKYLVFPQRLFSLRTFYYFYNFILFLCTVSPIPHRPNKQAPVFLRVSTETTHRNPSERETKRWDTARIIY